MPRPKKNYGKHFRALVISEHLIADSAVELSPKVEAKWVNERSPCQRTVYNRIRRNGYKVIVLFEVGSEKHADVLSGNFTTRPKKKKK